MFSRTVWALIEPGAGGGPVPPGALGDVCPAPAAVVAESLATRLDDDPPFDESVRRPSTNPTSKATRTAATTGPVFHRRAGRDGWGPAGGIAMTGVVIAGS